MKIAPFELELWMNRHELNVKFDIAESGIAPLSIKELLVDNSNTDAIESILNVPVGYGDISGAISLREEIAKTYSSCSPENIFITIGATEANFLIFHVLLNHGDHVITQFPAYQQLYGVPESIGCNISYWRCRDNNGFKFDLSDLKKLIRQDTKLIVINTPHNPTGAILSNAELLEIYRMAESVGAHVLSDEAFRWLQAPDTQCDFEPVFNLGHAGISVGTMSKPFGLPGLRIGWMAAQPEIIKKCLAIRHYSSLYSGHIDGAFALLAFKNKEKIFERNAGMIKENLLVLKEWLDNRADILSCSLPRAGVLCMLRYELDIPSIQLADRLAEEYSVLLAPGSVFGLEGYLRLGFGQHPDIFKQGIDAADKCFSELIKNGV